MAERGVGVSECHSAGRASCALVAGLLLGSWTIWQRAVDPPGNALVKVALAGTYGFDEPDKSVIATTIDAFRSIGLDGWLELRMSGLRELTTEYWGAPAPVGDWAGERRLAQLFGVGPTFGVTWLAIAAVIGWRGRRQGEGYRRDRRLLLLGLTGLLVNVIVVWGPQIGPSVGMVSVLLVMVGAIAALARLSPVAAALMAGVSVASCVFIWIIDPLLDTRFVNNAAVVIVAVSVTAALGVIWSAGVGAAADAG